MLLEHLKLLASYYYRPLTAASRTLDEGRIFWALLLAGVTALLLQTPSRLANERAMSDMLAYTENVDTAKLTPEQQREYQRKSREWAEAAREEHTASFTSVVLRPSFALKQFIAVALVFVPSAILLLAWWEGRGRGMLVLAQEYTPALVCTALAWTAAHLPLVPLAWLGVRIPAAHIAAAGYFFFLTVFCLRTTPGASVPNAAGAALISTGAMACGAILLQTAQPLFYLLASPCLLFYLYGSMAGRLPSFGGGLRSRQSYRRHLEATTLNPRDADAHYQLGLIQLERRNAKEAESRFRRAVEIDPGDADYSLALGRLLRQRGDAAAALPLLEAAARIDRKTSNHEILRELGAAQLAVGQTERAAASLEAFVARREYDPEGLVWLGLALKSSGRVAEARQAFERAVEAATSMPQYRRGQVRTWAKQAKDELARI